MTAILNLLLLVPSQPRRDPYGQIQKKILLRGRRIRIQEMERSTQKTDADPLPEPAGAFPHTRWTLVDQLNGGGSGGEHALGELCTMYWYPVYAFVRRSGASAPDAEDLTQGFFVRLLEKEVLASADAKKGRLRTYLLAALKRFRITEYRKSVAQKRGGGGAILQLDADAAERRFREEPKELEDPESLFERRWALSLLDEALGRLKDEYEQSGKPELFDAISPFLAGRDRDDPRYAELAVELGMTPGAVQVAVHRMRKRYRGHLEEAVAETIECQEDLEDELCYILRLLAG